MLVMLQKAVVIVIIHRSRRLHFFSGCFKTRIAVRQTLRFYMNSTGSLYGAPELTVLVLENAKKPFYVLGAGTETQICTRFYTILRGADKNCFFYERTVLLPPYN